MPAPARDDIESLDSLRAIAALSVLWFHFTRQVQQPLIHASGDFGWVGAHMFFVITGFVMPWALDRSGYRLASWPRFLARRMVRLHPPYVASLAVVVGLSLLSSVLPGYRGEPYALDAQNLLLHLFYATEWVGAHWAQPIYWTLAIEVQFYLLLALAYPLFASPQPLVRRCALLALCLLTVVVPDKRWVFGVGAYFALGIAVFLYRSARIPAWECALYLVTSALCLVPAGAVKLVGAVAMAGAILFLRRRIPGLTWIGGISYSLYLLHVPVGGRLLNFGYRYDPSLPLQLLLLAAAIAGSLLASAIFHRLVERPSQLWSKRVAYTRPSSPPAAAQAIAE